MATDYEALANQMQPQGPQTDYEGMATRPPPAPLQPAPIGRQEPAGLGTTIGASFIDDPEYRARYYAEQRGIPLERYEIREGRVGFIDDNGQWRPEVESIPQRALSSAGEMLPWAAGIGTGIATAPMWLTGPAGAAGSIGLTGGAAAAGQNVKELVAQQLSGQPVSVGRIALKGLQEAGGEAGGALAARFLSRYLAKDINRLSQAGLKRLQDLSAKYDIPLTAAELSNLQSLKNEQRYLALAPDSSDVMGEFFERRAGNVEDAITRQLNQISPEDSAEMAGQAVRGASRKVMERAARTRAARARPYYEAAEASGAQVDTRPVLQMLAQEREGAKGLIANRLANIESLLTRTGPDGQVIPDTTIRGLDGAQKEIRRMIKVGPLEGVDANLARILGNVRRSLLEQMDAVSPDYKTARGIFQDYSPGVDEARRGMVGVIASLGDNQVGRAAERLLGRGVGEQTISQVKNAIREVDPDAWQAVKRAFLQARFEEAAQEFATSSARSQSLTGAKFRAKVIGNAAQARKMRAAMEPEEWAAFTELMEVLEATGRAIDSGSETFGRMEVGRRIREQMGEGVLANVADPVGIPRRLREFISEVRRGRHTAQLADVVTSPDSVQQLRALRRLNRKDVRRIATVAQLLTVPAAITANSAVSSAMTPDRISPQAPPPQALP